MKKSIILARLVRQEKIVVVDVPDDFDSWDESKQDSFMKDVYESDNGEGFSNDEDWGCDEGTHTVVGNADEFG